MTSVCWLLLIALFVAGAVRADFCPPRHWFNAARRKCLPCTPCSSAQQPIVLRTCQLHQDTICGRFDELELDRPRWHHHFGHRRADEAPFGDQTVASASASAERSWDWQPSSMAFAAVACALFVAALLYVLYQHAKQWRHMENMERRFDRDVEQLSAQLMHNIVDLRSIDANATGGAIRTTICGGGHAKLAMPTAGQEPKAAGFHGGKRKSADGESGADDELLIGCAPGEQGCPMPVGELRRCVYLEQLLVGASPMRGNVYTEETKPTRPPRPQRPAPSGVVAATPPGISALGLHRMHAAFGKK